MTICPRTGIALPECSCSRCTEELLRRVRPELLDGEITITRTADAQHGRPSPRRRAV